MALRWRILLLLFLLRLLMAFQFATIGAIAPLLEDAFQVDSIAIGALIGMYFAPGIIVALAGGTISSWFGDKRIVLIGLALMALGSGFMALESSWGAQNSGRFIAGIGGVILNVVMSKMVMDWFDGHEMATAMSIFINSWPAGIALALVVQPTIAEYGGVILSFGLESILAIAGFFALLLFYRAPEQITGPDKPQSKFPRGHTLIAVISGGIVWGLFNGAVGIVFSFSPTLLVENGSSLALAGLSTSFVMLGIVAGGIFGGFLTDRIKRPQFMLILTTLIFAALLLAVPRSGGHVLVIASLGLVAGLCVGPIITLPAKVLNTETRATGMGIFYMLYYVCFSIMPWLSGELIVISEVDRVFDFGAAIAILSLVFLWFFQMSFRKQNRLVD
jgi:MFS family permease